MRILFVLRGCIPVELQGPARVAKLHSEIGNVVRSFVYSTYYAGIRKDKKKFAHPGKIGNLLFPISDMVEMRAAGGRLQGLGSAGLGLFLEHVPGKTSMVTLELKSKQTLF